MSDYQIVKETILKAYELVPEAYRQIFGNFKKETDKTCFEFRIAREKNVYLTNGAWVKKRHKFQQFERNYLTEISKILFIHQLKIIQPKIKLNLGKSIRNG